MGKPIVGEVVVVPFPFSNLKGKKRRPALVLAQAEFNNLILCQITSKPYSSQTAIQLELTDFLWGRLPITSFVRPDKLFTAEPHLIISTVGGLAIPKLKQIIDQVRDVFRLPA